MFTNKIFCIVNETRYLLQNVDTRLLVQGVWKDMWYMDAKGVAVFAHGFPYDIVMLFQDVSSLNILN